MTTERGRVALFLLAAAAVLFVVLELGFGGLAFGKVRLADPCTAQATVQVGGVDGTVQRFALTALSRAACDLDTSREDFVLSLGTDRWDRATVRRALRDGVTKASNESGLGPLVAALLRELVADPLAWYLGQR
jgi:hypothetical protein